MYARTSHHIQNIYKSVYFSGSTKCSTKQIGVFYKCYIGEMCCIMFAILIVFNVMSLKIVVHTFHTPYETFNWAITSLIISLYTIIYLLPFNFEINFSP